MGATVGKADGFAVGAADGDAVGNADGFLVGAADGDAVGNADGFAVGTADGDAVGNADGFLVGAADGDAVGAAEGAKVGCFLGREGAFGGFPGLASGAIVGSGVVFDSCDVGNRFGLDDGAATVGGTGTVMGLPSCMVVGELLCSLIATGAFAANCSVTHSVGLTMTADAC